LFDFQIKMALQNIYIYAYGVVDIGVVDIGVVDIGA
jgi:hypothetical protein